MNDQIDIVWENIKTKPEWEYTKNILINLAVIFIILFLTTPSSLIHLMNIDGSAK